MLLTMRARLAATAGPVIKVRKKVPRQAGLISDFFPCSVWLKTAIGLQNHDKKRRNIFQKDMKSC